MGKDLEKDLNNLLEKHAIVDVIGCLSGILQLPGGDSEKAVAMGKILEALTDQSLWD